MYNATLTHLLKKIAGTERATLLQHIGYIILASTGGAMGHSANEASALVRL